MCGMNGETYLEVTLIYPGDGGTERYALFDLEASVQRWR